MTTAQTIFTTYGVLILTYGFLLGVALAAQRMRSESAQRHLGATHLSTLIQGAVHLGLAFAAGFVELQSGWVIAGAWLLVAASALETIGGTVNWLTGTGDQFAERSLGFRLNSLVGPPAILGMGIMAIGVIGAAVGTGS